MISPVFLAFLRSTSQLASRSTTRASAFQQLGFRNVSSLSSTSLNAPHDSLLQSSSGPLAENVETVSGSATSSFLLGRREPTRFRKEEDVRGVSLGLLTIPNVDARTVQVETDVASADENSPDLDDVAELSEVETSASPSIRMGTHLNVNKVGGIYLSQSQMSGDSHVDSLNSEVIRIPDRLVVKAQFLEESGVTVSDFHILLKKRALVSVSLEKLKAVISLLQKFFKAGDVACSVLAQNSGILSRPIDHLEFKLKCLEQFELEAETCQKIGTAKHAVLTMAGESLWQKLIYLQSIGLTVKSMNTLLSRFPQVLRLTVEASIQPTLHYLKNKGMATEDINKLILKHPSLLAMSVGNNLDKKFELLEQLGFSNEECHKSIGFLTLPSCERARAVLETLKSWGISDMDVSEMIRKNPDIFSRSPENISKKMNWLLNEGNRDIKEIVHYPTCLCFHLDNRIIPRITALKESKDKSYPLSAILSVSEDIFRRQFNLPDFPSSKKSRQPRRQ